MRNNYEGKEKLVSEYLEPLLVEVMETQTPVQHVEYMKHPDGHESVEITFVNPDIESLHVNVTGDSCLALVLDVMEAIAL